MVVLEIKKHLTSYAERRAKQFQVRGFGSKIPIRLHDEADDIEVHLHCHPPVAPL